MSEPLDIQSLEEYLATPVLSKEDIFVIESFFKRYVDKMFSDDFDHNLLIHFEVVLDKFVKSLGSSIDISSDQIKELNELTRDFVNDGLQYQGWKYKDSAHIVNDNILRVLVKATTGKSSNRELYQIRSLNQLRRIYTKSMQLYNSFVISSDLQRHIELYDFYLPDVSDKESAIILIDKAINLIEHDNNLTSSAQKRILNHLKVALNELKKPNPNWIDYFGRVKEVIIVLGALGSFIGGYCALSDAKDKLDEATRIIEKTSINMTYIYETNNITMIPQSLKSLPAPSSDGEMAENGSNAMSSGPNMDGFHLRAGEAEPSGEPDNE